MMRPIDFHFFNHQVSFSKSHSPKIHTLPRLPPQPKMTAPEMDRMSKPRSGLSSLPQELRDHIYEYLLATTFLVKNPHAGETSSSLPLHPHTDLAILHVSRSIHREAKRVLYRQCHFHFNAFSVRSPPLHEEIEHIPDLTLLQDITLHLDTGAAFLLGYNKLELVRSGTMLINHFANLDSGVPRRHCLVEIEFILDFSFLFGAYKAARDFKDALGSLTGFKIVEVKIGHLQKRRLEYMFPLYKALDERLTMTLGEGEGGYNEGRFCLIYRPQRG